MASSFRIALANIRFPGTPEQSGELTVQAIESASVAGAGIICFPECFVPGYRSLGRAMPPPDPQFLERAWSEIAKVASKARMTVTLGTERLIEGALLASAIVINSDRSIAGFQDKVQLDPSEESTCNICERHRRFPPFVLRHGRDYNALQPPVAGRCVGSGVLLNRGVRRSPEEYNCTSTTPGCPQQYNSICSLF